MINLLIIPVQTVSDIITNSSSEVFILNTDKSCDEIDNILSTFTTGFRFPEIFSLKDYREWRKKFRNNEIEDNWSYPGSIFKIANGWFKDPEDEEDLLDLRKDFLFDPFETIDYGNGLIARSYGYNYKEPIHEAFIKYINDNWDRVGKSINKVLKSLDKPLVDKATWHVIRADHYWMEDALDDLAIEFLKNYDGPKPTVWNVNKREDVRELDGKVLVVSTDDNSIPYDTWDQIRELFNGWNVHLG